MMVRLWDRRGVPHKGWRCVRCDDLGQAVGQCQMCGKEEIRYVHHMEHDEYDETVGVGCVCAGKMEDDYARPKMREQRMKNKASRRQRWLARKWRESSKGNDYINAEGLNVVVFPYKRGPATGKWGYRIDGQFGKRAFATADEAKLAAFEEFWARVSND